MPAAVGSARPPPGATVPPLALEPAREPEWGVARGATWETSPAPESEWEPTAPVPDPGWEPEPVRGARWEFEPVRDEPWQPVGDTPWQPGLARIPLRESEPVRETPWQANPTRTAPHEPEPVTDKKYGVPAGGRVDLGLVVPPGGVRVDFGGAATIVLGTDPTDGEEPRAGSGSYLLDAFSRQLGGTFHMEPREPSGTRCEVTFLRVPVDDLDELAAPAPA